MLFAHLHRILTRSAVHCVACGLARAPSLGLGGGDGSAIPVVSILDAGSVNLVQRDPEGCHSNGEDLEFDQSRGKLYERQLWGVVREAWWVGLTALPSAPGGRIE